MTVRLVRQAVQRVAGLTFRLPDPRGSGVVLLLAVVIGIVTDGAQAQSTLYWDADGGATTGTGGTGSWNLTDSTWRNGSTTGALQAWGNGNKGVLGGTAGTVTLSDDIRFAAVNTQLLFSTAGYTINNAASSTTSGNSLTFDSGTNTGNFIVGPETVLSTTINAPLVLTGSAGGNAPVGFRISGGTFTVNGNISGDRGLHLGNNGGPGLGRLVLNGNNSFTGVAGQTTQRGGVSLSKGTLVVGSDTAMGTGNLYWESAGILEAGNGNRTVANTVTFNNDPNVVFNGTNSLTFNNADAAKYFPNTSSQFTVTEAAATLTFGSLTESLHYANGGFTKLGAGTLAITGTYGNGGQTTVSEGTLLINGTTGDKTKDSPATFTGQKNYSVAAGATLGGTGTINLLSTSTAAISGTVAPGLVGSLGTLTLAGGTLDFATDGSLLAQLDAASFTSDLLSLTGTGSLTLGGTSILDLVGPASFTSAGTYTLATFPSGSRTSEFTTVKYNGTTYASPTSTGGINSGGTLVYNADSIQLVVVPEPGTLALAGLGMSLAGILARGRRRSV